MSITWMNQSRPELSDALIGDAEEHFGVQFPESWLALLREQNGGYIEEQLFRVPESVPNEACGYVADGFVPVNQLFGIGPDTEDLGTIYCTSYMTREWELPEGLVLLDGDGQTWLELDYRARKTAPAVVFVLSDHGIIIPLAPSFDRFLLGLTPYSSVYNEDGNRRVAG